MPGSIPHSQIGDVYIQLVAYGGGLLPGLFAAGLNGRLSSQLLFHGCDGVVSLCL